ncbi:hypothetical protein KAT80_02635 [Candidatus Pacearchaeota archaeon]|nr:hypothetical protein [Candidatus Pacearchaeota archaeon]
MTEVIKNLGTELFSIYNEFILTLPPPLGQFVNLLILVLMIVLYSIFVWKFYKFISKKNPVGLDLNQYNKFQHSFLSKLTHGTLYFVEYLLILPFMIFIIFTVFTFFLIILAQSQETSQILIISAAIITAIRMTAYYKENLSQEIAKMLPFTLLAITVLNPNNFADTQYIERIFSHISNISGFFSQIITYLIFIIIIEAILRFFDFIFSLFGVEEQDETAEEVVNPQ